LKKTIARPEAETWIVTATSAQKERYGRGNKREKPSLTQNLEMFFFLIFFLTFNFFGFHHGRLEGLAVPS